MKQGRHNGFTIIETMLFLAISGVLFVGIMVGAGAAIASQRYRDAVVTLQQQIQQEYSEALNVSNGVRITTGVCGGTTHRGNADCEILGRLVSISPDGGGEIKTWPVIGQGTPPPNSTSDLVTLGVYNYVIDTDSDTRLETTMEWGTSPSSPSSGPGGAVGDHIYILIIRAPETGRVYTFSRAQTAQWDIGDATALNAGIQTFFGGGAQEERVICVHPQGLVANTMAVAIGARAATATAVEALSPEMLKERGYSC